MDKKNTSDSISASLEDYLEAIYEIIREKNGVKAVEVSRRLGVGRSSVTEALKNLAEKGLVNYGRYDAISLTSKGEEAALKVILKHNVLYDFFTHVLDLAQEEAHENACRVEHVISENALKKFKLYIEFNKQLSCRNHNHLEEFKKFCKETEKN